MSNDKPELLPEIEKLLQDQVALGLPRPGDLPAAQIRAINLPNPALAGPPEDVASTLDTFIPGPTAYIPVRIIRPKGAPSGALPAMVYFHGGGWVLSSVDHYDTALRSFANKTGSIVIAPNYQKAPEHKFPIPFDDCYATYQWVVANAEKLGIDASKIGVAGDSAGGNLAAAVALKVRDEKFHPLAYQALIYPCCDDTFKSESATTLAEGYGLTTAIMEYFVDEYVHDADRKNPYAFPVHAKSLTGVAPAVIATAQYDVLRDDGIAYAEKLKADGVDVKYINFDKVTHGSFLYAGISSFTNSMHQKIADLILEQLRA